MMTWLRKNPHAWWSLLTIYILLLYFIPEQLVTDVYTPTQIPLDDRIPFCPPFVTAYVLWFPILGATGLYLLLTDAAAFKRYMWALSLAYTVSAVFFLLFPNGQDLRPALTAPRGLFETLLASIYRTDTNTNVLPSLHVVGALVVVFAMYDAPRTRGRWMRPAALAAMVLISASTVLVKQHAILDLAASLVLAAAVYLVVYVYLKKRRTGA